MNFAVVKIAGKQFLVRKGDVIETPKISGAAGDKVVLESVLLHWDGKGLAVGRPCLEGVAVEGKILGFGRGPKVVSYKFKRRKDSHRKIGHRQDFARLEIGKITAGGKETGEAGEKTPPAKAAPRKKSPAAPGTGEKKKKPASGKKSAGREKPAAGKKTSSSRAGA